MGKQLLFIDEEWIKGYTCIDKITNPIDRSRVRTILEEKRRNFITKLENEGFEITTDRSDLDDTLYFIMNPNALVDSTAPIDEYYASFVCKMKEAGGPNMNIPYTVCIEDYFVNPFFPAVFKNQFANGGVDKLLIENKEQVEIIKRFYEKYNKIGKMSEIFSNCVFQQYIKTPTKYSTYMRVLIAASGDIMGASLKYSKEVTGKKQLIGIFEKYFCNPNSEYYLDCKSMFGYYSGKEEISFCQPMYSKEKKSILEAHKIDSSTPNVPSDVQIVAKNIMENCNKELGIICGMDFIYNEVDDKWYYLENQAFPAIEEWAKAKKYDLPCKHTIDNYIKYLDLDLQARYEALQMTMDKRNKFNREKLKELSIQNKVD